MFKITLFIKIANIILNRDTMGPSWQLFLNPIIGNFY